MCVAPVVHGVISMNGAMFAARPVPSFADRRDRVVIW
jgi:hypothetical protein